LIHFLDEGDDESFIDSAVECVVNNNLETRDTPVVYTPLHGTGGRIIPTVIERAGFSHVFALNEQMIADPDFSTCPSPNPEDMAAYNLGIEKANQLKIDHVIATDPDADRVGVCVRRLNNDFKLLSGNELGALLLNYILEQRHKQELLSENSLMIDTVVTSDLGKEIARKYELYNISVLTGFKYIGSLINEFNETNEYKFEFGYEESLGFLAKGYVADKDAVSTALIIVEMINYYKGQNKNLLDVLNDIYEEFGYYLNKQISIMLEPNLATKRIEKIMEHFRNPDLVEIIGHDIVEVADYERQIRYSDEEEIRINLPQENAIKISLKNDCWIAIRPSGTEPKLKFYLGVKADSLDDAKELIKNLQDYINDTLEELFI